MKSEKNGMIISGHNPKTGLAEVVELTSHPWLLACQFHPEYKSRPQKAHPLFNAFTLAAYTKTHP